MQRGAGPKADPEEEVARALEAGAVRRKGRRHRQTDPWGSLTSQTSRFGELKVNDRAHLREPGR